MLSHLRLEFVFVTLLGLSRVLPQILWGEREGEGVVGLRSLKSAQCYVVAA